MDFWIGLLVGIAIGATIGCIIGALDINRLLKQYQTFYNTAQPHRTLAGQSPIRQQTAANDAPLIPGTLRAEAIVWLGGLYHSYRRAA